MDQALQELIVYTRTIPCPDCMRAKRVLEEYGIPYTEIMIDLDSEARARVESWTGGFQAVPTLVLARPGDLHPMTEPRPLEAGRSPRGVDRGSLITEPDVLSLKHWLTARGLIPTLL
jgi:glutaredoxin